jgi:hypothetical protein
VSIKAIPGKPGDLKNLRGLEEQAFVSISKMLGKTVENLDCPQ